MLTIFCFAIEKECYYCCGGFEYLRSRFCHQCRCVFFSFGSRLDTDRLATVQACCRSLIVDTLPIPLQQAGSAWGRLPQMRSFDQNC